MRKRDDENWQYCNSTWERITRGNGNPDAKATDFSPEERTVVLVWTVLGIVENGGFEYLFSGDLPGDDGYRLTLRAFREIGCADAVNALKEALAGFPEGLPADEQVRAAKFKALDQEYRDRLMFRFIGDGGRDIETKLAAYIRAHDLGMKTAN